MGTGELIEIYASGMKRVAFITCYAHLAGHGLIQESQDYFWMH